MKPYLHPPGEDEDLFARARRSDPSTSHEAAASVRNITGMHRQILHALSFGALTDEEIYEDLTGIRQLRISPSGARSRRAELVDMAMVIDTGERKLTKSGRKTIAWRLR